MCPVLSNAPDSVARLTPIEQSRWRLRLSGRAGSARDAASKIEFPEDFQMIWACRLEQAKRAIERRYRSYCQLFTAVPWEKPLEGEATIEFYFF